MSENFKTTENGAIQYEHCGNQAIEFFSKAGSLRETARDGSNALDLFKPIWYSGNYELAIKLLFWVRDARGGAGNRNGFRECLKWLSNESPDWVSANAIYIPEHGRWDDLRSSFNTASEQAVVDLWSDKIAKKDFLASKWAKRTDKPLLRKLRKMKKVNDIGEFRRLLAKNRSNIIERFMCSKLWQRIKYSTVCSKSMSLYTNAFQKHDAKRFDAYKDDLVNKKTKINASVLFPHDCVITVEYGQKEIGDAQFKALPNYMGDTQLRIMPIVDSSGSMMTWNNSFIGRTQKVSGNVKPIDISRALGLYCSDRLGEENPFYRKYMQFSSENRLTDWVGKKFSDAIRDYHLFDRSISRTNIELALNTILKFAKLFNASNEQIPNCLLILSDMQFNQGNTHGQSKSVISNALDLWEKAGYSRPKIVYWNLCGLSGSPERFESNDIGLVSGYSPSILSSILGGKDFTPLAIMEKAIEKYKVNIPK